MARSLVVSNTDDGSVDVIIDDNAREVYTKPISPSASFKWKGDLFWIHVPGKIDNEKFNAGVGKDPITIGGVAFTPIPEEDNGKSVIDLLKPFFFKLGGGGSLSTAAVSGSTFEHEPGVIQEWIVSGDETLVISGLEANVPATGFVKLVQAGGGDNTITLPGVSNSISYRTEDDSVTFLGYIWDGSQIYWNSDMPAASAGGVEPEAQAFFDAEPTLDSTQKTALNNLVKALKLIGWSKFRAVYPFIGSTAAQHKWNLIDPRDLDAAFRLVFTGGNTHSANGVLSNGSTGFINTKFAVGANFGENPVGHTNLYDGKSFHISYYRRTTTAPGASTDNSLFGHASSTNNVDVDLYNSTNVYSTSGSGSSALTVTGQSVWKGLWVLSRVSSTLSRLFRSRVFLGELTAAYTANSSAIVPLYINAKNNNGNAIQFAPSECAFASIGEGLSDSDITKLTLAVDAYQTALSRNV